MNVARALARENKCEFLALPQDANNKRRPFRHVKTRVNIPCVGDRVDGVCITSATKPWTEFGDINCEAEMAFLDDFAIQLQNSPSAKGVMIFCGGRLFRGRLPKPGEAEARAARLKPYLVERRGIPAARVVVINGGYREDWLVELLIISPDEKTPVQYPTLKITDIKFRKGKAHPRDFRCRI